MTKRRDHKTSLFDIIECSKNCTVFVDKMDFTEFEKDTKTISAVLHQIMIIGEATKRLGIDFSSQYPHVPWRKMAGMRDVLIHHYEESDLSIAWGVVKNELPQIIDQIQAILKDIDPFITLIRKNS